MPKLNIPSAEELIIKKAVAGYEAKLKQDEIDTEIRNRILDAIRKKPGHKYY